MLQEKNLEAAALGLAPMYPAYLWSNSTAPGHYGYKRASDLISGKASKLAVRIPSSRLRREDRSSIALFTPSQTSAGNVVRQAWACPLSISLFGLEAPFLAPAMHLPEGAVRRGCQDGQAGPREAAWS